MTKMSDNQNPKITFLESAAPSTPASTLGFMYEKTDGIFYTKNDAGTETALTGLARPGSGLDYVEFTAPVAITATTEGTANTVVTGSAVTYDGSTIINVEFFSPYVNPDGSATNRQLIFALYDGAASIGLWGYVLHQVAATFRTPVALARRLTPSAAAHTYSVRAFVNGGTGSVNSGAGGVGNDMPGFIRITKV